jgi:hypothetical protein
MDTLTQRILKRIILVQILLFFFVFYFVTSFQYFNKKYDSCLNKSISSNTCLTISLSNSTIIK